MFISHHTNSRLTQPLNTFLRSIAACLSLVMFGGLLPAPLYAAGIQSISRSSDAVVAHAIVEIKSAAIRHELDIKLASVVSANFTALARPVILPFGQTLLDDSGRMARPISPVQIQSWKGELRTNLFHEPQTGSNKLFPADILKKTDRDAQLHIWVGECALAYDQAPSEAVDHFRLAYHMTRDADRLHGQAAFDIAVATYLHHNLEASVDAFRHLLLMQPTPAGFDRQTASLWLRHATACLGYHLDHARQGIPESTQIDPMCGAAALAASLRQLALPFDKKTVLASTRVTEEGSSLQDLIDGGMKLGVVVRTVSADEKGLELLPKPVIAYVEQDHFVSVVRANEEGVTYLCSDCGAWPGGSVHLSWSQWRLMTPGIYGVVVKPQSDWDQFLEQLPGLKQRQLAAETGVSHFHDEKHEIRFTPGSVNASIMPVAFSTKALETQLLPVAQLLAHLSITTFGPYWVGCGSLPDSPQSCPANPPMCSGGPPGNTSGATAGEPVNLATGEEVYTPPTDLTVYNPLGPSVTWGRVYESLRSPVAEPWYENQDYGLGWSHNYNLGVNDPTGGMTGTRWYFTPEGGRISFAASAIPTASNPVVVCSVETGCPILAEWDYNPSTGTTFYTITNKERTKYITSSLDSSTGCCVLSQIVDRNGNAINFNYSTPISEYINPTVAWPLLSSITDKNGEPLLVINREGDNTGAITSIDDRYGRTVYYHVGYYTNEAYVPYAYQLDHVSQIEPTDTANPPDRYHYNYTLVGFDGYNQYSSFLHSISVPNPSGSSTPSVATINYVGNIASVQSLEDANGNVTTFTSVSSSGSASLPSNYTKVIIANSRGQAAYGYTVGFDINMDETSRTDYYGNLVSSSTYSDANNPYSQTTFTNGNGKITNYKYDDTYCNGNLLEEDDRFTGTPGSIGTTYSAKVYTYDYSNFRLGELKTAQDSLMDIGSNGLSVVTQKAATSYTYFEPSGNLASFSIPAPGSVDGTSTVTYSYEYDVLGDVTQVVTPGNNACSTKTVTLNYGSSPAIDEVLSVTDNLGNTTYFTYNAQQDLTSVKDPSGYQTFYGDDLGQNGYNIANQLTAMTYPSTNQTGPGHSSATLTYLYPGGPQTSFAIYDESSNQVRQVSYSYGAEGESTEQADDAQPVTYTYDALYQVASQKDGSLNTTSYYYNLQGYLNLVTMPGYTGQSPQLNAATGMWGIYNSSNNTWALVGGPDGCNS